jgi:hypothetical protein
LGGGMLKAEAIDLQPFAAYFDFPDIKKCRELFNLSKGKTILNVQKEISTNLHREIDNLVFDYIGLNQVEQEYIKSELIKQVNNRYNKTTAR